MTVMGQISGERDPFQKLLVKSVKNVDLTVFMQAIHAVKYYNSVYYTVSIN